MVSHERMKGAEGGLVRPRAKRQVVSKGTKEDKRRDSPQAYPIHAL